MSEQKKRALLGVANKTGLIPFARSLSELGFELVATGGTLAAVTQSGLQAKGIEAVTGFPECLDGRVKTLHPAIHAGLLAVRDKKEHMDFLIEKDIKPFDLVAVNLYPFKETMQKPNVALEEVIENIDIGGPSMLRSASKNYKTVTVLTSPDDYDDIIAELKENNKVSEKTNLKMAGKAFAHTAYYDSLIASYFSKLLGTENSFPETLTLTYQKVQDLRYGENPHQNAAFYAEIVERGADKGKLTAFKQLHGKEISFNNINDTHGALELLKEFDEPVFVACKHGNPCGVGTADNIYDAYMKAYTSDPKSIFGGILVANRNIDLRTAQEISGLFAEIVLAPGFDDDAFAVLSKKKNIRLLVLDDISFQHAKQRDIKKVSGGILVQDTDTLLLPDEYKVVTKKQPTTKEIEDLKFTWKIVKHVKSNAIALGKDGQSIGIGAGQVNRIWACNQAIEHAVESLGADSLKGAVLASDAFFPMRDCVDAAAKAGIKAIMQPGGSLKDKESIDACDEYGIAMIFTGMRHFKH